MRRGTGMKAIFPRSLKKSTGSLPFNSESKVPSPRLRELITVNSPSGAVNLVSLALPLFLENLFNYSLGTVNTAVLGNYSQSSVAAVGTINTVISFLTLAFSAVATGVSVVVSNAIGAGNDQRRKRAAFAALLLSLVLALGVSLVIIPVAPWIVKMMNLVDDAYWQGLSYLRIRVFFIFLLALSSCMLSLFSADAPISLRRFFITRTAKAPCSIQSSLP